MESTGVFRSQANLKLVQSSTPLNAINPASESDEQDLSDTVARLPVLSIDQAESFIDTSQNWPVCMLDAPPSQAGRIRFSYAFVGGLGTLCGTLLLQDLIDPNGLLTKHPAAVMFYALLFAFACFIQFNFSYAARTKATIEQLRETGQLDFADEQEYLKIEKQERQIKSLLGLKAFGILTLMVVAGMLVASPITGRVTWYDSVRLFPPVVITWFWLLGVQQHPARAAIYGFVGAGVSLCSVCMISGVLNPADMFSFISSSIIVGLVINRSGTQNLGWPPIAALFLCRLFASWVALVIVHMQHPVWTNEQFVSNVLVPLIITAGWSAGLLIANAIVNDTNHLDNQGRPMVPNALPDSESKSLRQKPLAEETFLQAEQFAQQPGSENRAEESYKKSIALYPYEYRFYYRLGQMYNRQQRYKEAEILFKVAARVAPDQPDPLQNLAALLYNQKHYSQARDTCLQALRCPSIQGEQHSLVSQCLEDSEKLMKGNNLLRYIRS